MPLRVAIVGCGSVSWAHARGWLAVADRAGVVALADPNAAERRRLREHLDAQRVSAGGSSRLVISEFDDYARLIDDIKPDVVDICLPHHLHKDCILAACRAPANWLCEKPLCLNLDEAGEIRAAMRTAGVTGMCAHNQLFLRAFCEAKRMLNAGMLGQVYTILSQDAFIMGLPPPGSPPGVVTHSPVEAGTWRADRDQMGGGELIDTGYHPAYRLLYLAGELPSEVVAVTARYRCLELAGEDTAFVLCRFPSGVTGEICTSWAMELPAGHHLFHVIGERGELYGSAERLHFQPNRMQPATWDFAEIDTFVAEIRYFVDCIEHRRTPISTHEDGIAVLELILRAYAFAHQHGMIG